MMKSSVDLPGARGAASERRAGMAPTLAPEWRSEVRGAHVEMQTMRNHWHAHAARDDSGSSRSS